MYVVLTAASSLVARPALLARPSLQIARHEPPRAWLSADAAGGATGWAVRGLYHAVRLGGLGKHGVKEASGGETKGGSRAVWTRSILETENYILGVQTLRNALTSASFFSSSGAAEDAAALAGSPAAAPPPPSLSVLDRAA